MGDPGTGKSRVIKWLVRMFEEAMMWTHGVEFVCLALQNRVAYAMKGHTMHSDGEVRTGNQKYAAMLESRDIDSLFTKNEHKRVIIIDELFMIPDSLLGKFCLQLRRSCASILHKSILHATRW